MIARRTDVPQAFSALGTLGGVLLAAVVCLWLVVGASWVWRWVQVPPRRAGPAISLAPYGLPGTHIRITAPAQLRPPTMEGAPAGVNPPSSASLTVTAWADSATQVEPFELALRIEGQGIEFVSPDGLAVPGRLEIAPGYPDPLPYALRVAHADTQHRGGLLLPLRVGVVPVLLDSLESPAVSEGALTIALTSRLSDALHDYLGAIGPAMTPYVAAATVALGALWALGGVAHRRYRAREAILGASYGELQEQIRLERWPEARRTIEEIRQLEPGYREVGHLDALVAARERAAWRQDSLLRLGLESYRQRDWASAARILSEAETLDPYDRDVHFFQRTASLYADLRSRDRSRRRNAARELGEVADLLDWEPLTEALGDPSEQVAEAAQRALATGGPSAVSALVEGLRHRSEPIRARSYRVLQELGQDVRDLLLGSLRSNDALISRQVALLLASLGARRELAEALLWIGEDHVEGLVAALAREGASAAPVLIETLLRAPDTHQQRVLQAIAALKEAADITRLIEQAYRGTHDPEERRLLEQALKVSAGAYMGGEAARAAGAAAPSEASEAPEAPLLDAPPEDEDVERGRGWRLRLFERRS